MSRCAHVCVLYDIMCVCVLVDVLVLWCVCVGGDSRSPLPRTVMCFAWLSLPTCGALQAFWDYLMQVSKQWGLVVYEQDWLNDESDWVSYLTQSATLGRQWLMQMGSGADKSGIAVQYCMSLPRHIMQSVEVPAMVRARLAVPAPAFLVERR